MFRTLLLGGLLPFLPLCAHAAGGADSQPTRNTASHGKRVIGYITQWDAWKGTSAGLPKQGFLNHLNIDYSQYTHLNFSFFGVAQDGSLHSGDFRNPNIYQAGQVQAPAALLNGDVYSSWDYYLVWGELSPQWNFTSQVTAAGFESYGNGWRHTPSGLTGPMPVPYHVPGTMPGVLELAHAKGVKVMASIGGWSMCKHYGAMAADPVKRARFVADCQRLIALGFDGIDFDWEYPGTSGGMNFVGTQADYANFVTLMQEVRAAIGSTKQMSAALSCAPSKLEGFDWTAVAGLLDSIDLMTYDVQGGWSDKAGHNAPLYAYPDEEGGAMSCDTTVQYLIGKGVPRGKIALGLPFYGRGVVCSGSAALGASTVKIQKTVQPDGPITTCGDFAAWGDYDATPNYEYIRQNLSGWTRHWDDVAKVPYLTKGSSFLSYDDSRSIGLKAEYVRAQNLGGVIVWHAYGDLRAGAIQDNSAKLPYSPATDAPLVNVVNSVLAGDAVPADGTEGPSPATGPQRGLNTLPSHPLVIGYLNGLRNAQGQDQVISDYPAALQAANLEAFDVIVTAFAEPKADGTIGTTLGSFSSYLPAVVNEGHTLGKSVVVSIGGAYPAALADQYATIAASPTLRQTFANNVLAFLQANHLDGLDIDYEFPADAGTSRTNFTALMQTLYTTVKAADSRYIVMFGSGPGWYLGGFDFATLGSYTDFFFYFGYDWKNPANGSLRKPGSTQWTLANDQLPEASVKGGVDYVLGKGFPASKVIVGLPFYGSNNHSWSSVRDTWAANQAAYTAAIDPNALEVQINGEWFTPPDAMKRKMDGLLSSTGTVLAGGATVRGVGCWEIGHEHASHPDLSNAFAEWIAGSTSGPPVISVAGGSIAEGNVGTGLLNFTITLSKAAATSVTVDYATANGTATAGSDYVSRSGTLVFAAGETSKTIAVTINGDETVEANETFTLTLSNPTGGTLGTSIATGTITNDDSNGPGPDEGWTSHAAPAGITLSLVTSDSWSGGFGGELHLTNSTGAAMSTWNIQFDAPWSVASMWNGVFVGKSGNTLTVTNPTWGGYSLANNTTAVIGFTGSGSPSQPTNLRLNGQAVGSGGSSFATWASTRGITATAYAADPDGDGRSNLLEFLNGTSPQVMNYGGPRTEIRALTVSGNSGGYFCVVVPADTAASNVEYRVIASATPAFSPSRLMVLQQTVDLGGGKIEAVWRDNAPMVSRPTAFARIEMRVK
ncbi:cellulose binding domain-containing protein [Luteolibacter ambystomatis]|uniref:chitinase n=1 Tax=Luteolibacter ambystomatis TaxID=2824561 RepID=A0A975G7Z7_9BACT|nr:glycosyl hydrolase family 18 protein [Luteolibacter ambystomatis]QUE50483.1 cellulose binding domain-containing protein [Luteolibacter ambystomatis]